MYFDNSFLSLKVDIPQIIDGLFKNCGKLYSKEAILGSIRFRS